MSINLYWDIETIPVQDPTIIAEIEDQIKPPGSMKKEDTIAKWEKEEKHKIVQEKLLKTSFDGAYGQIWSMAYAFEDEEPVCLSREAIDEPEADILTAFYRALKARSEGLVWVGHNILDFDLKFLFHRSVINRVRPSVSVPVGARPNDPSVYDTMRQWAGWRDYVSLDTLCLVLGIPTKGDLDGSKVWDYVQQGRIDEVMHYNVDDVRRVRSCHRRMTFA